MKEYYKLRTCYVNFATNSTHNQGETGRYEKLSASHHFRKSSQKAEKNEFSDKDQMLQKLRARTARLL